MKQYAPPVLGGNVYRLFNEITGEHFFTTDENEKEVVLQDSNWKDEGIGWYSPVANTPVYRFYNPSNGDHMFTIKFDEATSLQEAGWVFEGINFVSGGNTPIYRLYNPNAASGTHIFTADKEEYDNLKNNGWLDEGIAFYGE